MARSTIRPRAPARPDGLNRMGVPIRDRKALEKMTQFRKARCPGSPFRRDGPETRCRFRTASSIPLGRLMVNAKTRLAHENMVPAALWRFARFQDLQEKIRQRGADMGRRMIQVAHLDEGAGMMFGGLFQPSALVGSHDTASRAEKLGGGRVEIGNAGSVDVDEGDAQLPRHQDRALRFAGGRRALGAVADGLMYRAGSGIPCGACATSWSMASSCARSSLFTISAQAGTASAPRSDGFLDMVQPFDARAVGRS